MNLVARTVKEAGIDKNTRSATAANASLKIDGGAPLLVHDAHLDRVPGRPSISSTPANSALASATSSGPCISA